MAVGGYFDNSGLEAGLSYLQANQSDWIANDGQKDFEITMFIVNGLNQIVSPNLSAKGFGNIGNTVERLFEGGEQMSVPYSLADISHPNSAVFSSNYTLSTATQAGLNAPIWSYTDPTTGVGTGFKLENWEMDVKTIAGNTMNIGAGYEGTINYWSIQSSTGAAPIVSGSWGDYETMYNQIITALQTQEATTKYGTVTGAALLADHLGYAVM